MKVVNNGPIYMDSGQTLWVVFLSSKLSGLEFYQTKIIYSQYICTDKADKDNLWLTSTQLYKQHSKNGEAK